MSHPKHGTVLVPLICLSITTHLFHWWTCLQYNDRWPTTPEKQNSTQWIKTHLKHPNIKCPTSDLLQHLENHIPVNSSKAVHDIFYISQFSLFVFSNTFHLRHTIHFTSCHSLIHPLLQFLWVILDNRMFLLLNGTEMSGEGGGRGREKKKNEERKEKNWNFSKLLCHAKH